MGRVIETFFGIPKRSKSCDQQSLPFTWYGWKNRIEKFQSNYYDLFEYLRSLSPAIISRVVTLNLSCIYTYHSTILHYLILIYHSFHDCMFEKIRKYTKIQVSLALGSTHGITKPSELVVIVPDTPMERERIHWKWKLWFLSSIDIH